MPLSEASASCPVLSSGVPRSHSFCLLLASSSEPSTWLERSLCRYCPSFVAYVTI